jgi:hypothetical protein
MRKTAIVLTLTLVASMGLVNAAQAGGPRPGVPRIYEGETSQGKRMAVGFLKRSDGSLGLKVLSFRVLRLTCSVDLTVERWSVTYFIGGRGWDLAGRSLDVADNDGTHALTIQGTVKATTIEGTLLRFAHAGLTIDEEPQLCTTGDLTWSAERTVPPVEVRSLARSSTRPGTTIVRRLDDGGTLVLTRLR